MLPKVTFSVAVAVAGALWVRFQKKKGANPFSLLLPECSVKTESAASALRVVEPSYLLTI